MDTLRLGLVGYGLRGRSLLSLATQSFERIQVAAICTERPTTASEDYPEARLFEIYEEMLDSVDLNAIIVETPATHHGEFLIKALEQNIHVMGDVPAVESVAMAQRLWEAQQRSQAFYTLGANNLMWGFVEAAVALQREGLLGDPYYMEAEYVHDIRFLFNATPWRRTLESIKYCTHSLGPLLRLIDEDLTSVSCFDTGSHINEEQGQHDAMVALFRTPNDVVVRLLTTFINYYPGWGHRYRVYGTKGYFERTPAYDGADSARTLFYSTDLYANKALIELPIGQTRPEYGGVQETQGHGGADYVMLEQFFASVRQGGPAPIGLREALRMTLPGIYAADSARHGGRVTKIIYPWSAM